MDRVSSRLWGLAVYWRPRPSGPWQYLMRALLQAYYIESRLFSVAWRSRWLCCQSTIVFTYVLYKLTCWHPSVIKKRDNFLHTCVCYLCIFPRGSTKRWKEPWESQSLSLLMIITICLVPSLVLLVLSESNSRWPTRVNTKSAYMYFFYNIPISWKSWFIWYYKAINYCYYHCQVWRGLISTIFNSNILCPV